MKLIEALTLSCGHYMTEARILQQCDYYGLDPNSEVTHGQKISLGLISFMVYDNGGDSKRKLVETPMEEPAEVVCPTCGGTGKVLDISTK
jgi:hypothetical protein